VAAIADGVKIPHREGRTLIPEQAKIFLQAVKGDRLEAAYVVACGAQSHWLQNWLQINVSDRATCPGPGV
jgi:hypothetical protein